MFTHTHIIKNHVYISFWKYWFCLSARRFVFVPARDCTHSGTAILIIFEGRFQIFQQFSSSKLVQKSRFAALN